MSAAAPTAAATDRPVFAADVYCPLMALLAAPDRVRLVERCICPSSTLGGDGYWPSVTGNCCE